MPLLSRDVELGSLTVPVFVQLLFWSSSPAGPADINIISSAQSLATGAQLEGRGWRRGGEQEGGGLRGHNHWHAMMLSTGHSKGVTHQARPEPELCCSTQSQ